MSGLVSNHMECHLQREPLAAETTNQVLISKPNHHLAFRPSPRSPAPRRTRSSHLKTITRRPRTSSRRALCLAIVTLGTLSACSGQNSSQPAASAAGTAHTLEASAGGKYAAAQVATFTNIRTSFPAPGPELPGIKAKISGKTVWYIPVFLQAVTFQAEAANLTAAMRTVGANLHVCDAQLNPSTADSCIRQAVSSGAAGIVTSAIGYSFAPQAFQAAAAAKVPVISADNDDTGPDAFPASSVARQLSDDGPAWAALATDWIIADSAGRAKILYAADDASQGTVATKAVTTELAAHCTLCILTVVHYNDNALPKLATAISSALIANPDIDYVYGGYDVPAGIYALQGAKQVTGRKFKFVTISGAPTGLQRIFDGSQAADAGVDTSALAWNMTDALFRLISKVPQVNYQPGIRLFTKGNLPPDTHDIKAYTQGAWYSNGGFRTMYDKLWNSGP